eukprot:gnl/Dysnectes_brevis/5186_a7350_316.p1 GENE.gnl/Dysnectes_brevis/5186_a7350_316~~gnl/Dysnectes_brevis/5186_a7350_316.p1  ORF type:complete len:721 (+),score=197.44 gnl/Dysnectes_brevis/5186_a7350_316:135-2297(+)
MVKKHLECMYCTYRIPACIPDIVSHISTHTDIFESAEEDDITLFTCHLCPSKGVFLTEQAIRQHCNAKGHHHSVIDRHIYCLYCLNERTACTCASESSDNEPTHFGTGAGLYYSCPDCSYFNSFQSMCQHIESKGHANYRLISKQYTCPACQGEYRSNMALINHLSNPHHPCCHAVIPLARELGLVPAEPASYECPDCDYCHATLSACSLHARSQCHAYDEALDDWCECPVCENEFTSGSALISHLEMSACDPSRSRLPALAKEYGIIVNWAEIPQEKPKTPKIKRVAPTQTRVARTHTRPKSPDTRVPVTGFQCPLCAVSFPNFTKYREHFLTTCPRVMPTAFTVQAIPVSTPPFDAYNTPSHVISPPNHFQARVAAVLKARGINPQVFGSFGTLFASPTSDIDYIVDCNLYKAADTLRAAGLHVLRLGGKGKRQHLKVYEWEPSLSHEHVDVVPLQHNDGLLKKRIRSNAATLLPVLPAAARIVKRMAQECGGLAPGTRKQKGTERSSSSLRHNLMWAVSKGCSILHPPSLLRTLSPQQIHSYLGLVAEAFDTSSPAALLHQVLERWVRYNRKGAMPAVDICGAGLDYPLDSSLPSPMAPLLARLGKALGEKPVKAPTVRSRPPPAPVGPSTRYDDEPYEQYDLCEPCPCDEEGHIVSSSSSMLGGVDDWQDDYDYSDSDCGGYDAGEILLDYLYESGLEYDRDLGYIGYLYQNHSDY